MLSYRIVSGNSLLIYAFHSDDEWWNDERMGGWIIWKRLRVITLYYFPGNLEPYAFTKLNWYLIAEKVRLSVDKDSMLHTERYYNSTNSQENLINIPNRRDFLIYKALYALRWCIYDNIQVAQFHFKLRFRLNFMFSQNSFLSADLIYSFWSIQKIIIEM